ncbi:hypothetical protein PVAND_017473 [Polypedilum vanderplanki]|uniref:DNA/RNA non-specific endonuclease/pyrophosphatase/phosphodiesterase domain-containing protein n=1 Tax=Polypedilum vanderplanki TaxID=319348 RepID=A0A9J6BIP9_POLVA|nr:hypothetical protein PVAND_017473 [Polypedilum vanderplanki]
MHFFSILIIAFYLNSSSFIVATAVDENGCNVNLRTSFSQTSPLLIQDNKLYRPTSKSESIIFAQNETVEMYCEEWLNVFDINSNKTFKGLYTAICDNGNNFLIQGTNATFQFQDLMCKDLPRFTRKQTITKCYSVDDNAIFHEIGYQIDNNRALTLYESCFNGQRTWYTKYDIDQYWKSFFKFTRPQTFENDIYSMRENYFDPYIQKEKIRENFSGNLPAEIQELYENGGFFSQGLLAASSDFIFPSDKNLTFHLINVAPQWSKFDGENWMRIETATANYAAKKSKDLFTYTGTYGVIDFKAYGFDQEFYLGNSILPVPKLFYKIITNGDEGVVFIGLNDPFPTNTNDIENYKICQDISDDYNWDESFDAWNMHRQNISKGYSYACELNEFLDVVKISYMNKVSGVLGATRKSFISNYSAITITIAVIVGFIAVICLLICIKKSFNWFLRRNNNYNRLDNDSEPQI